MPENYTLPEHPEHNEEQDPIRATDEDEQAMMPHHTEDEPLIEEPPVDDDDTDALDIPLPDSLNNLSMNEEYDDEHDVPFHLPKIGESDAESTVQHGNQGHNLLTMPHFREPGVPDPCETLSGSGGRDPNPDMQALQHPSDFASQQTVEHARVDPNLPLYQQEPPLSQDDNQTMANPNVADRRFQRPPQQRGLYQAQGQYVPPPPKEKGRQLPRQRRGRRRILGLRPGCLYMFLGLVLTFCGGFTFISISAAAIFVPRIEAQWTQQIDRVDEYRAFESTFIYDRYGNELFEDFSEGRRDSVRYDEFPENLLQATVSIEDDTFFSNPGIDVGATSVAVLQFLGAEDNEQTPGGSTITQQLVRNVLFDFEKRATRSIQRKAEEIILALLLTGRKSKEDILELYLNEIYYGNLAYGAQAAAQSFFGKNVGDLTLGEAALLAGLPQAPASLDPLNPDPEIQTNVFARWRIVLDEMVEEGYITEQERNDTLRAGLNFVSPGTSLRAPHFTVYAQSEFEQLMLDLGYAPDEIARGGWRVYTTVDQEINNIALGAARTQVSNLQRNNVSNAAVVVIKPLTGEIMGMVGSVDYNNDAIDGRVNVTTALRQPGSTMKPFTYSAAIERGMTPGDVIWDTRTEIGIQGQPLYTPVNYDRALHGPVIMRRALANSYNIPAVQTLRLVGVDYLLQLMNRFGVETLGNDASRYGLSLTLGGGEVSLLELTNAYGVFANQGAYVEPTAVLCIVDSDDNIIYQYENGCPQGVGRFTNSTVDRTGFGRQVLDPRVAYVITDILSDNAARTPAMGANSPLRTDGIGTAVKTGTTDDVKDNWTVGYTRNVVVGVWVGNNNGDPMVNSSGLTGAAPIWNSVITSVYSRQDLLETFRVGGQLLPDIPSAPSGMTRQQICDARRITDPSPNCPAQISEWFLNGPAGIPDGNGNLIFPDAPLARPAESGTTLQEISPDIFRALVFPVPPQIAAGIQFPLRAGEKTPPPPRYCRLSGAQAASVPPGAQEMVFIALPSTSHNDTVEAELYAQQRGLATLPRIECWDDVFSTGGGFGAPITTAVITSPANGQTVTGNMPVIGTVQFDSRQADFYHLDLIGGPFPNWTPLGEEGFGSVIDGQLGFLNVEGLPPGNYRVRVRLVKDGNFIQQPYEVSFIKP